MDRSKSIPATKADKLSEVQNIVDALKINGYTDQFIKKAAKIPKDLPTSLKHVEVSSRNRKFKEFWRTLQGKTEKMKLERETGVGENVKGGN